MTDEPLRLMFVHAHPDDESSKGAATMAAYVAEGLDVVVVTCTGGERGSVLSPKMDRPEVWADITAIRRAEMEAARAVLGVRQTWLGFVDSGLPEAKDGQPAPPLPAGCFALAPLEEAGRALVEVVRRERPHVLVTYDEKGGYPHPDHVMTHVVSMEAFRAAGDPAAYPGTGEPWAPLKLYYTTAFHKAKLVALHEEMLSRGLESPYAERLAAWEDKPADAGRVTTRVACGDYFAIRDRALLAHATQVDPDGWWFKVPLDVQRSAWPTEDYQLVESRVEAAVPEDDLLAGLR